MQGMVLGIYEGYWFATATLSTSPLIPGSSKSVKLLPFSHLFISKILTNPKGICFKHIWWIQAKTPWKTNMEPWKRRFLLKTIIFSFLPFVSGGIANLELLPSRVCLPQALLRLKEQGLPGDGWSWEWIFLLVNSCVYVPWSKVAVLGLVIQPLIGNPYNGYINPYYWVDDHPLLYGNIGSLDPSTYNHLALKGTKQAVLLEIQAKNPGVIWGPWNLHLNSTLIFCFNGKGSTNVVPSPFAVHWQMAPPKEVAEGVGDLIQPKGRAIIQPTRWWFSNQKGGELTVSMATFSTVGKVSKLDK